MEADVVLAAEGPGVGQRRGGDERLAARSRRGASRPGAGTSRSTGVSCISATSGSSGPNVEPLAARRPAQPGRAPGRPPSPRPTRGDQHPPPDIRQKFPPAAAHAHRRLPFGTQDAPRLDRQHALERKSGPAIIVDGAGPGGQGNSGRVRKWTSANGRDGSERRGAQDSLSAEVGTERVGWRQVLGQQLDGQDAERRGQCKAEGLEGKLDFESPE